MKLKLNKFLKENKEKKLRVKTKGGSVTFNDTQINLFKVGSYDEFTEYEFDVVGTNMQIKEFYDMIVASDDTTQTNFGGCPFEWASQIILRNCSIGSPRAWNGDKEWYHPTYNNRREEKKVPVSLTSKF